MFCHFSLFLQIYLEPSVLTLNFVLHYIIKYKLYFLCPIGLIFIAQCSLILRGSYLFELILLDCNLSLFKLIKAALIWQQYIASAFLVLIHHYLWYNINIVSFQFDILFHFIGYFLVILFCIQRKKTISFLKSLPFSLSWEWIVWRI